MIPYHAFGKGNIYVRKTLQAEIFQGLFDVLGEECAAHADRMAVGSSLWQFFSSVGTDRHTSLPSHTMSSHADADLEGG